MTGRFISISARTRPMRVSNSPVRWKIRYIGISTAAAGIILVDSIHISRSLVLWPGTKAIDQAAGMAMSSPSSVEPTEMTTEFQKNRG